MSETQTETPPETEPTPDVPDEPTPEPETEPSQPDDNPDLTEELGDAEQPQPVAMSERELEEASKKLERSATTWRNRVSEVLGEAANDLVVCELCNPIIPGFHFPAAFEQPRDDLHARLLDVLKNPAAPEFRNASHVRRCADCDGWGQVLSGSRVAGKERVKCPTCQGNGFQGPGASIVAAPVQNGEVDVEFPQDTEPLVSGDNDIWGSPRLLDDGQENPNYGKMPQYKNPSLP